MADGKIARIEDGRVIYRASAFGGCIKALAAARQDMEASPPPPQLQAVFDRGHDMEPIAAEQLFKLGWDLWDSEREVVYDVTSRVRVVGHIDHMGRSPSHYLTGDRLFEGIVEVKSQNAEEWAKDSIRQSALWDRYRWQVGAYQLSTSLPVCFVRINKDTNAIKFDWILEEVKTRADFIKRAVEIEQAARRDLNGISCEESYGCPYWKLHTEKVSKPLDEVVIGGIERVELSNVALSLTEANKEKAKWERRYKAARDKLLERVGKNPHARLDGVDVTITESNIKEKVIPAGTMVRVTVKVDEEGA